jgi:hypothetical protein
MTYEIPLAALNDEMHKRKGLYYLPFVPDHFDHLDIDQPEITVLAKGDQLKFMIASQAAMGAAVTAFMYNRPIAVFGVVHIWNGVGEMWSLFDNAAREYRATMLRGGRTFTDIAMRYLHLHRLQITVRTDDDRAMRYAQAIGFETESTMTKFGPDKVDYLLMTRF